MGRFRRLGVLLILTSAPLVLAAPAEAYPNSVNAGYDGSACIYWRSSTSLRYANICVYTHTGAGYQEPPPAYVTWGDFCYSDPNCTPSDGTATFDPADFNEDPAGTSATLDTTVNGCRLTMSLQAAPASATDGVSPVIDENTDTRYGLWAGAGLGRTLPASGSGSICNDDFAQGPGSSAFITRFVGAGVNVF